MIARLGKILVPTLLVVCTAAIYLPRLQDAPVYLARDEMYVALTAHSLASTGRDLYGRFMPLYFEMDMPKFGRPMWFQPILMYAIALAVKVLPFSEGSIRLPMALAGIVNVVLMYFTAKFLFKRTLLAIAAAVLFALTPAHFVHSRLAEDFQAPLPFIGGWLLCLSVYLRWPRRPLLFAAGMLLGVGLYSYVAAGVLMPIYGLLTCALLYQRRETLDRYWTLAAGFALPALLGLSFILQRPSVIRDVVLHYRLDELPSSGTLDTVSAFVDLHRIVDAVSLYWNFWNPRFLFIDSPPTMAHPIGPVGIFLLPVVGLLCVGLVRAVRRPSPFTILLVGGLLSAPLPASAVGEAQAIRRALEVLPFVVLLAVSGLEYVWKADTARERRIAFVAMWGIPIFLVVMNRAYVPHAQAMLRILTVPLVVIGLALLLRRAEFDRRQLWRFAAVAVGALLSIQAAYVYFDYGTVIYASVLLVAMIGLVTLLTGTAASRSTLGPIAAIVLLALVSSEYMYFYIDYSGIHRMRFVPASVVLMMARCVCSSVALAVTIALAIAVRGIGVGRLSRGQIVGVTLVALVAIQGAYFYVDYFTHAGVRLVQSSAVLVAAIGAALLLRGAAVARLRLGQLAVVAVLAVASIQFAYFYADYFTGSQVRGSGSEEGNVRIAAEAVIARARTEPVPAVHFAKTNGLATHYWEFYLVKHGRQDLLSLTTQGDPRQPFEPDRIRQLPTGSLVITSPDTPIEQMVADGELKKDVLLTAPDGTRIFWILQRSVK